MPAAAACPVQRPGIRKPAMLTFEHAHFTANCIAPHPILDEDETREESLGWLLAERGIQKVFAPNIAHEKDRPEEFARILPASYFSSHTPLPFGSDLYECAGPVEGLLLPKGSAFSGRFAGCLVLVAASRTDVIVAHGSRDALIDRRHVLTGKRSRGYPSVIDAMAGMAWELDINPRTMQLYCLFGTPAESFAHELEHPDPDYQAYNRNLPQYLEKAWGDSTFTIKDGAVYPDISAIGVAQARNTGFGDAVVMCRLPYDTEFADTRHPDVSMRSLRNRVVIW